MKTRQTKTWITQNFKLVWPIQGRTMWKLTSWGFRKCGSFRDLEVLNQSYWLSKSSQISKKNCRVTRRYEKKIRPQYWVLGSDTESAWDQHGWFHADSMATLKFQNYGRGFFFYGSLFLLTEPKFHSRLTLSSNNSRSKPHTPNKFHIFGIVRTSAFRWTYPGFFFPWANFEEQAFYEKRLFFAFLHDRTEKIFKWPPIGQYWRQRASQ